ncbi:DnaJ domain-containing protein, partial [Lasiosphaeria miniovina]
LYDRLGIHHTATHEDVKQSYRKAALKWHPDKNTDSQAEDRFKECSEAYEVLADPSRRQAYDRHGLSAATSSNPN